jgi:uncharacterized protein YodC (DUF2158 family)
MAVSKKFKVGDLVVLKSGGPVMVVTDVPLLDGTLCYCTWFSGKKNENAGFPQEVLDPVPKEAVKP